MGTYHLKFNPELLSTFLAVADAGSVSGAAKIVYLSQPAVTAQIRKLEATLETHLFHRSVNGTILTASGQRLYDRAKHIYALLEEAEREATEENAPSGRLVISASTTIASHLIPPLLAEFHRRYPQVELILEVANSEEVLKRVRQGSVPLGLVEGYARAASLRLEPFVEDEIVPVVPPEIAGRIRNVAELLRYPLIWRESGSGTRAVVERALKKAGFSQKYWKSSIEIGGTEAIKSGVAAGLGVAFLSRWSIQNEIALGKITLADLSDLKITRMFHWVLSSGNLKSPAAEFLRFTKQSPPVLKGKRG